MFLDGHKAHLSIDLVETAIENDVSILCLPAHTSHALQPLDVGVFNHAKRKWKEVIRIFLYYILKKIKNS